MFFQLGPQQQRVVAHPALRATGTLNNVNVSPSDLSGV
jgi:hypothetical protein